jgi:predicted DNA binding CopG/RHH family protein
MNKTKRIEIRLTLLEEKLLKVKAKETGLPVSTYVRNCALGGKNGEIDHLIPA